MIVHKDKFMHMETLLQVFDSLDKIEDKYTSFDIDHNVRFLNTTSAQAVDEIKSLLESLKESEVINEATYDFLSSKLLCDFNAILVMSSFRETCIGLLPKEELEQLTKASEKIIKNKTKERQKEDPSFNYSREIGSVPAKELAEELSTVLYPEMSPQVLWKIYHITDDIREKYGSVDFGVETLRISHKKTFNLLSNEITRLYKQNGITKDQYTYLSKVLSDMKDNKCYRTPHTQKIIPILSNPINIINSFTKSCEDILSAEDKEKLKKAFDIIAHKKEMSSSLPFGFTYQGYDENKGMEDIVKQEFEER